MLGGKGNFRYDIDSLYKKNRVKADWQYFDYIKHNIIPNNFNTLVVDGVEADDVVASYTYKYKDVIIMHDDKDLLQIPGVHIFRNNHMIVSETEAAVYLWEQVLMGDSTDNISGVPGIGKVNAKKLLKDASIVNMFDIVINEYIKKFKEKGVDEFWKNYRLIKLKHNVALD